jgi:tRNA pseudouridine55 synthase
VEQFAPPEVTLRIACAKGTYVRTLAADLGGRLGCGAALAALRRTRSGAFSIDQAAGLDALLAENGAQATARLMDLPEALHGFHPLTVDAEGAARARHGQMPDAPADLGPDHRVMVIDPEGRIAALAESVGAPSGRVRLRALRVFHGDGPRRRIGRSIEGSLNQQRPWRPDPRQRR